MTGPEDDGARDRALLTASLGGSPGAFGDLVARHLGLLWQLAVALLGDPGRAADAVQDGVLAAYRASPAARGEVAPRLWLARAVVDACGRHEAGPPSPRGTLPAALAALPRDLRAAVVLVDVAGLAVDDAARVLAVPAGTVRQRSARGRARLAVALGHLRNRTEPPPVIPDGDAATGGGTA